MKLVDSYGRKINYLRLSVTDRCNLRCRYCMPAEGVGKLGHGDVLSYEELYRIASAAVASGIEKIRITGGEPLVRKGLCDFLARLAALPGLKQLVLTTNGLLLPEMAADLKAAGVQRLNISLDSLRPATFERVTRRDALARVLAGISAAEKAGFPVKLNVVAMRGVNDDEFEDFAALTLVRPIAVRFIEYMPTLQEEGWRDLAISGEEILARIARRYPFRPLVRGEMAGPASEYRIDGAPGTLGVITPVSGHFCRSCNRIRVTSAGMARSCLFSEAGVDLRAVLRAGGDLAGALRRVVTLKPGEHGLADGEGDGGHQAFAMSHVGG